MCHDQNLNLTLHPAQRCEGWPPAPEAPSIEEVEVMLAKHKSIAHALRTARQGIPEGEYRVDADALRKARQGTPQGEYHVDAEALRKARQGTPQGEYHVVSEFVA